MIKKYCLLMLISMTAQAQSTTTHIDILHWQTAHGAEVYFVPSPQIPMVDIKVIFTAGSAFDGNKSGLSSLVNSLIGEGTQFHDADQVSDAFDNVGAQFSQDSDQDTSQISLRTLTAPAYETSAIAMFAEVITKLKVTPIVLQRIKQQTLANIRMGEQTPGTVASEAFFRLIYQEHPYAHPTDGTIDSVNALTQADVDAFYKKFYVAKNAKIIIVGQLTAAAAKNMAEQVIGELPSGEVAPPIAVAQGAMTGKYQFISFPSKQDTIIMGQVGISPLDPNRFALMVGNQILGGQPLSSILFNEVRNQRGLAYQVASEFAPLKCAGPFYIQMQTRTDQANSAMQVTQKVLAQFIAQGPTVEQLTQAQQNMIGSFPLRVASNANILNDVAAIAFYGLPLDYLNTYTIHIAAVDAPQVKSAFQNIVHINALNTVVVGARDPAAPQKIAKTDDNE